MTLHIKPSTSLCLHPPSPPLRAPKKMLGAQRLTEHRGTITAYKRKTTRRTRRQPISGLLSLQHLGGTEPSGRPDQAAGGGQTLLDSATRNYAFVNLTRRWRITSAGDYNLASFLLTVVAHGGPACFHNMKNSAHTDTADS